MFGTSSSTSLIPWALIQDTYPQALYQQLLDLLKMSSSHLVKLRKQPDSTQVLLQKRLIALPDLFKTFFRLMFGTSLSTSLIPWALIQDTYPQALSPRHLSYLDQQVHLSLEHKRCLWTSTQSSLVHRRQGSHKPLKNVLFLQWLQWSGKQIPHLQ